MPTLTSTPTSTPTFTPTSTPTSTLTIFKKIKVTLKSKDQNQDNKSQNKTNEIVRLIDSDGVTSNIKTLTNKILCFRRYFKMTYHYIIVPLIKNKIVNLSVDEIRSYMFENITIDNNTSLYNIFNKISSEWNKRLFSIYLECDQIICVEGIISKNFQENIFHEHEIYDYDTFFESNISIIKISANFKPLITSYEISTDERLIGSFFEMLLYDEMLNFECTYRNIVFKFIPLFFPPRFNDKDEDEDEDENENENGDEK